MLRTANHYRTFTRQFPLVRLLSEATPAFPQAPMTDSVSLATPTFAEAARRVQQRLVWRKGLELLLKTWRWAALVAVVLLIALVSGGNWVTPGLSIALLLAW